MLIQDLIFIAFAIMLIFSAAMVIFSKNAVTAVLYLVYAFFNSAVLWMLMEAEFLSLVLIFVYVGAVMTLFLFVVMMINIDIETLRKGFVKYLPLGMLVVAIMIGIMVYVLEPGHLPYFNPAPQPADYSNIKALGTVLYTYYGFSFELAAILLLTAIIAAIILAYTGKPKRKVQSFKAQISVNKKSRLRITKM